jgi:hypothetical protein
LKESLTHYPLVEAEIERLLGSQDRVTSQLSTFRVES